MTLAVHWPYNPSTTKTTSFQLIGTSAVHFKLSVNIPELLDLLFFRKHLFLFLNNISFILCFNRYTSLNEFLCGLLCQFKLYVAAHELFTVNVIFGSRKM